MLAVFCGKEKASGVCVVFCIISKKKTDGCYNFCFNKSSNTRRFSQSDVFQMYMFKIMLLFNFSENNSSTYRKTRYFTFHNSSLKFTVASTTVIL